MKLIKILLMALIIFMVFPACIRGPRISKYKAASLNAEEHALHPPKTAVVVPLFGEVSEKWVVDAEKALQNPKYDLVVLWIESPGGSVTETKIITHKLKVFQKKYNKPIYIYSERILASGAYWVASSFDKIIISPAGHAGSIGVYMVRADFSGLYNMIGLKYHYIASDSTKVMGNSASPMENWEREIWQSSIYVAHAEFMVHVWNFRVTQIIKAYELRHIRNVVTRQDTIMVANQFRQIANGSLYNAKYSIFAGLVDNVMYFDELIKQLQLNGYATVTADGKTITEFYPFKGKDDVKEKIKQKIWDRLQAEQNRR